MVLERYFSIRLINSFSIGRRKRMKQYLDLLQHVLDNGSVKGDRTGTGTLSVFGYDMRINLNDGFPLLTTKKVHLKSIIGELLWFLDSSTSSKELEINYGTNIWKEWENEKGELPNIYGKQWGRGEGNKRIIKVKKLKCNDKQDYYEGFSPNLLNPINPEEDQYRLVGNTYTSNSYGEFIVIENLGLLNKRNMHQIQFVKTGYTKSLRTDNVIEKSIRDPYYPIVYGVGFIGEYKILTHVDKALRSVWGSMLERCYVETHPEYCNYGGKGVFVSSRWHNFQNFIIDVQKLTNWHLKKYELNKYVLDKDYYGSNCYSKETCVWLDKQESQIYREVNKPFSVGLPDGQEKLFIERDICRDEIGIDKSSLHRILNGKYKGNKYKDYEIKYVDLDEDSVYRYKLPINQISSLIRQIKENPDSRRLLVSAWNVSDLDIMALPPCHYAFQFYVCDNKLSCKFNMRSTDIFLGLPFNIASYALLTMMIAQVCNLELGDLIFSGADVHIYSNHIEQVKLQLSREPRKLPTMYLNVSKRNIFDFTPEDFILDEYDPHPSIKAPVAI